MRPIQQFLDKSEYIDYDSPALVKKAAELFPPGMSETGKAKAAYLFVRDEIPHSFDRSPAAITARASDVLANATGICHAKANLLAALLRSQSIPVGFCFQRLTLLDDDSMGYCVHAYNAVWLNGHWARLDARGNKEGVCAAFSLDEPQLAFYPRPQYDEYFWKGIYAKPHAKTMAMLDRAHSLSDILEQIPDMLDAPPDLEEEAVSL